MKKTKILSLIVIFSISITLTCIPALATTQFTKTTLYFNVAQVQEVTVTLLGNTYGNITAVAPGTQTLDNLNFSCAVSTCSWVNASSFLGTGGTQSASTPALTIKNTGSIPTQLNISANDTGLLGCEKLRYENSSANFNVETNGITLTNTNVTLMNSTGFVAGIQLSVWLFGNFSSCASGSTPITLWVWSYA